MGTNYSDIEVTRGVRTLLRRVRRIHDSAQPLMDTAIEQNAREVLRQLPIVTEYVQAMGSWHFSVELTAANGKPHYKGELLLGHSDFEADIRGILEHHDECKDDERESGDVVCVEHYAQLEQLLELLGGHGEMMSEFTDMFGDGLSPMRFTADGPKITEW